MITKVFYNHSCSICKTEIDHYKKITKDEFDFIDITNNHDARVSTNLDKASLLRRMHVIENGTLYSGAKGLRHVEQIRTKINIAQKLTIRFV